MKLTKNWKNEIKEIWGIMYCPLIFDVYDTNTLLVTKCSKFKKQSNELLMPKELYTSKQNIKFYSFCEQYQLPYAILSDKYGLFYYDETKECYDIHPSQLSDKDKENLGLIIKNKALQRDYNTIIFYASSPLMSKPYFDMLSYSGLQIFFATTLIL